jgi:hypothetical protein
MKLSYVYFWSARKVQRPVITVNRFSNLNSCNYELALNEARHLLLAEFGTNLRPGLPDFSWCNITKREKYTK